MNYEDNYEKICRISIFGRGVNRYKDYKERINLVRFRTERRLLWLECGGKGGVVLDYIMKGFED